MTREMMERLYGNMNTQGGNRGPYGVTEGLSAVDTLRAIDLRWWRIILVIEGVRLVQE